MADVEGTVTPVSVATDTAGPPITVAQDPDQIVITPDSKRAYVLSYDGTVTPIMTATNTAGQTILVADAVDKGAGARAVSRSAARAEERAMMRAETVRYGCRPCVRARAAAAGVAQW